MVFQNIILRYIYFLKIKYKNKFMNFVIKMLNTKEWRNNKIWTIILDNLIDLLKILIKNKKIKKIIKFLKNFAEFLKNLNKCKYSGKINHDFMLLFYDLFLLKD